LTSGVIAVTSSSMWSMVIRQSTVLWLLLDQSYCHSIFETPWIGSPDSASTTRVVWPGPSQVILSFR
jgi:hypothetical protein